MEDYKIERKLKFTQLIFIRWILKNKVRFLGKSFKKELYKISKVGWYCSDDISSKLNRLRWSYRIEFNEFLSNCPK